MITKVQTIEQIKQIFLEIFINKTDKISDISDNSVINATAYGVAKVAQKCMKDIAIVESHIFPDSASGKYLDNAATLFGVPGRISTAVGSSTYLRLIAAPGTTYTAGTHTFTNYNGIQFSLPASVTIGAFGWEYVKINSVNTGSKTNVDANSVISVSPIPVGHIGCTNEYKAEGGTDIESDEMFRIRIKKHNNILAKSTTTYFAEIFRTVNPNIFNVINLGNDEPGNRCLGIVLQNGQTMSQGNLDTMLNNTKQYFPITDLNMYGNTIGIKLLSVDWEPIDMDFRVQIDGTDQDKVRKQIQINLTKYLDFRFWDINKKVEWDNLLEIVKSTEGVRYVQDTFFNPSVDIKVPIHKLPRIRGFIMRTLDGTIINSNTSTLLPIFYPLNNV
jgi:hypothetical protein